jgi:hypothetical protein
MNKDKRIKELEEMILALCETIDSLEASTNEQEQSAKEVAVDYARTVVRNKPEEAHPRRLS